MNKIESMARIILQNNNSPMAKNVLKMIDNKDYTGLEEFARNACKSKGIDPDEKYKELKDSFGLK